MSEFASCAKDNFNYLAEKPWEKKWEINPDYKIEDEYHKKDKDLCNYYEGNPLNLALAVCNVLGKHLRR